MKIHYDYTGYDAQHAAITIGVFDGVHKGHKEILNRILEIAKKIKGQSVVVTFWPHPRLVLKQDNSIKLINTLEEKQKLLEKQGIDHLIIIPFTEAFSQQTSEEFIKNVLIDKLHVKHLVVGFNHHFGRDREGNFEQIQKFAQSYQFEVEKLDAKIIENEHVSSTKIRNALGIGDIETANSFLGYSYSITGRVVDGNKIGRDIGFPTANIQLDHDFKLLPKEGVYIVEAEIDKLKYPAMLNIGFKPTINQPEKNMSIEAHIIGFSGDIYKKNVTIYFHKRIRDEIKFDNLEQLKKQLVSDKQETINYFHLL
ncbi:MAG TPA: bifunctional riboflavin kinase/FAD synthetase [Bacteroidales bacterium]|nr:bifunctional riboflavin kinase/FAD synthetase [Bacteroidales bacterium]